MGGAEWRQRKDGCLSGAVLALAERTPAWRAGVVHEASDTAPPGLRTGEPSGVGAPGIEASS